MSRVPVIDVSSLYSASFQDRKAVADEVGQALKQTGFFYVKGHKVSSETQRGMFEAAENFFALDKATKMKYYIGKSHSHKGYVPAGEVDVAGMPTNSYEAYDYGSELGDDHPLVKKQTPFCGHNQWPAELPEFKQKVVTYHSALAELSLKLLRAISLALGLLEDELDKYFDDPIEPGRMVRYPVVTEPEDHTAGSHEDPEAITIIQADAPGLELEAEGKWEDVPPLPGTFVVNTGQALQYMSNGLIKTTKHRYRNLPQVSLKIPFYLSPNYAVKMEPVPQLRGRGQFDDVPAVQSGDFLWGTLLQAYRYSIDRVNSGEITVPKGVAKYREEWLSGTGVNSCKQA